MGFGALIRHPLAVYVKSLFLKWLHAKNIIKQRFMMGLICKIQQFLLVFFCMGKIKKVTETKARIKDLPAYRLTGVTEEAS